MEEQFLQLIKELRFLYDKSDKNYKDVELKSKAWSEIGNRFNKSGLDAESHFKNLLERYVREKKNGRISSAKKHGNIVELLTYIDDRMRQKCSNSWISNQHRSDTTSDLEVIPDEQNINTGTNIHLDDYANYSNHEKFNNEKKRENPKHNISNSKSKKYEAIMKNFLNLYNKKASNFTVFCNHLDAELNTMPVNDAETLKDEISELLIKKRRQIRNRC